jgi:hypothetical protein
MTRLNRRLSLFGVSALLSMYVLSTTEQSNTPEDAILNTKVTHLESTDQTLFDGLAKLSSERIPLALGFEEVLKGKFADPPMQDPRFSVEFQNKTVREILDTLCGMDARYAWSREGTTINVYPRAVIGDPTYLPNRQLDRLAVTNLPDPEHALLAIIQQPAPPQEQIGYAGVGGDSSYTEPWTVTFRDLTVRQTINRLATDMGPRSQWIFYGSRDFRSFAFFKAGFNTKSN